MLNSSHRLNQHLVLLIILVILFIFFLSRIQLDEFLLKLLLRAQDMLAPPIDRDYFTELRSALALACLIDNPHNNILEEVLAVDLR